MVPDRGDASWFAITKERAAASGLVMIRSLSDLGIDYRRNERVLVKTAASAAP
jgi:hypothetical protein